MDWLGSFGSISMPWMTPLRMRPALMDSMRSSRSERFLSASVSTEGFSSMVTTLLGVSFFGFAFVPD